MEIARGPAAALPEPEVGDARPIGVIAPYRAQCNALARAVEGSPDLSERVAVGTVQTFQGNECDVAIFDSVLGGGAGRGRGW